MGSSGEREWGEVGAGGQGRTCGPHSSEAVRGPRHIRAVLNALTMNCTEANPGGGQGERASSSSHRQLARCRREPQVDILAK